MTDKDGKGNRKRSCGNKKYLSSLFPGMSSWNSEILKCDPQMIQSKRSLNKFFLSENHHTKDKNEKVPFFKLFGGLSVGVAVASVNAALFGGVPSSWCRKEVRCHFHKNFIKDSIKHTLSLYKDGIKKREKRFGKDFKFKTFVIGTGLVSTVFICQATNAPFLPTQFLFHIDNYKDFKDMFENEEYFKDYEVYAEYGLDVGKCCCWVKFRRLPQEYIDFIEEYGDKEGVDIVFSASTTGSVTESRYYHDNKDIFEEKLSNHSTEIPNRSILNLLKVKNMKDRKWVAKDRGGEEGMWENEDYGWMLFKKQSDEEKRVLYYIAGNEYVTMPAGHFKSVFESCLDYDKIDGRSKSKNEEYVLKREKTENLHVLDGWESGMMEGHRVEMSKQLRGLDKVKLIVHVEGESGGLYLLATDVILNLYKKNGWTANGLSWTPYFVCSPASDLCEGLIPLPFYNRSLKTLTTMSKAIVKNNPKLFKGEAVKILHHRNSSRKMSRDDKKNRKEYTKEEIKDTLGAEWNVGNVKKDILYLECSRSRSQEFRMHGDIPQPVGWDEEVKIVEDCSSANRSHSVLYHNLEDKVVDYLNVEDLVGTTIKVRKYLKSKVVKFCYSDGVTEEYFREKENEQEEKVVSQME